MKINDVIEIDNKNFKVTSMRINSRSLDIHNMGSPQYLLSNDNIEIDITVNQTSEKVTPIIPEIDPLQTFKIKDMNFIFAFRDINIRWEPAEISPYVDMCAVTILNNEDQK